MPGSYDTGHGESTAADAEGAGKNGSKNGRGLGDHSSSFPTLTASPRPPPHPPPLSPQCISNSGSEQAFIGGDDPRRRISEMTIRKRRRGAAARRALKKAVLHEERLVHIHDGVRVLTNRS